jgi:hypothetical protein
MHWSTRLSCWFNSNIFILQESVNQYEEDSYQITKLVWNTHALNFNYCKIGVIYFCKVDMHSASEEQDRRVILLIRCLLLVLAAKCGGSVASRAIRIHNLSQFFCHDVKFPNLLNIHSIDMLCSLQTSNIEPFEYHLVISLYLFF